MGIIIAGMVVITMLLVSSGLMFSTFLDASVSGAQSLKELTQANVARVGSGLDIVSAAFNEGSNTDLIVVLANTGSQAVVRLGEMDLIIDYTNDLNVSVLTRLKYTTAAIGSGEWTLASTGVTPDTFNPGIWDSDESMYIDIKVDPAAKSGTPALIVVSTPWAVSDQASADSP